MRNTRTEEHDFYCMKCGEKIYSLPRKVSHKYQKHHYKRLWCWRCHEELNAVECRSDVEIKEFKEPRLMAKWDCTAALPSVFKSNDLNILYLFLNKHKNSVHA